MVILMSIDIGTEFFICASKCGKIEFHEDKRVKILLQDLNHETYIKYDLYKACKMYYLHDSCLP